MRPALLPPTDRLSRVLVTGGAGFIGSHVVDRLLAAGHEPRILDVRRSSHHPDVDAVVGDILDLGVVGAAMEGCDAVVHLAAAADVGEVASDPVGAEELNARGTINVLQAARDHRVDRVVYASTIWVYSDVEGGLVDEDTPLRAPAHLYTATKLAGELYCRSYGELYGVRCTILRFGIPYGPRARPAAVLPIFVRRALAGEPLELAGGGLQSRRFVYVEDLAEGVVRSLAPVAAGRTYNLVGSEDVTVRAIAETVGEIVGGVEVVSTEGRAADFDGAEISGARAAAELGWTPRTSFAEGARRYVAWHRDNDATPAPAPAPVVGVPPAPRAAGRALRRPLTARRALLALVGLLAGALAAALTTIDVVSDPASVVGTLVLLAIPVALIAGVDWTRNRRDAALVLAATAGGLALTLGVWGSGGTVVHAARAHPVLVLVVALGALAVTAVRHLARAERA